MSKTQKTKQSVKAAKQKALQTSQYDAFVNAARELGCDEDEARFDEKLGKLVKHKPNKKPDDSNKS